MQSGNESEAMTAVAAAAQAASAAASDLARAMGAALDEALRVMAARLHERAAGVLDANARDVAAAQAAGLPAATVDRLLLTPERLRDMSGQLITLAAIPADAPSRFRRDLPGGLVLQEWRRPVGVVGANFEARPNVVVDIASQLIKSRNAGVLRTGSSALRSAAALMELVVGPALQSAGLSPDAIQLIGVPGRESAYALVRQPGLIPLVILRGSGASTRELAREGALHGVRTLAHADGGAVIYLDESADHALAASVIEASLDRLGVCNRLNLLLVHNASWEPMQPLIAAAAQRAGVFAALPPHRQALGHEWALDAGHEATISVAPASSPADAAEIANKETSGLAAAVIAEDAGAAAEFLQTYAGTAGFWNATPRLLDGFKLLSIPETGINIDSVPGPRGPVTFRDLFLRQYVVIPRDAMSGLPPSEGQPAAASQS